jgi:hypothetical protein
VCRCASREVWRGNGRAGPSVEPCGVRGHVCCHLGVAFVGDQSLRLDRAVPGGGGKRSSCMMCRNSSLHRDALLVLALLGVSCGRTDRSRLEQPVATTEGDTTSDSAGGSTSDGEAGSTDAATTASAVSTTRVSAGGVSSNSTGSEGLAAGGASGGASTEGSTAGGDPTTSLDVSGNWAIVIVDDYGQWRGSRKTVRTS